jgi:uncharacterized membrane protein YhaH (DUF805 family)
MEPVQSIKTCLNKYADFDGRASRSEFWWFYLFTFVIQLLIYGFAGVMPSFFGVIGLVVAVGLFVPTIAVGCRRLHDRNMSGWLQLISIIPLAIVVLWVLWAMAGTEGDNKYGAQPLD